MSKAKEYFDNNMSLARESTRMATKTMNHKTLEDVEAKENDLLNEFCLFLEEQGYTDIDWRAEEPFAIDEFKKSNHYLIWKLELKTLKL